MDTSTFTINILCLLLIRILAIPMHFQKNTSQMEPSSIIFINIIIIQYTEGDEQLHYNCSEM